MLLRRTDINDAPRAQGFLGGYGVPVATFLRIRNGKIIEWEDMPTNKISAAALPFRIAASTRTASAPRMVRRKLPGSFSDGATTAQRRGTDACVELLVWHGEGGILLQSVRGVGGADRSRLVRCLAIGRPAAARRIRRPERDLPRQSEMSSSGTAATICCRQVCGYHRWKAQADRPVCRGRRL